MSEDTNKTLTHTQSISFELPDLTKMVSDAVVRAMDPDALQKSIDKHVSSTVDSAIDKLFGWHGPIKEQLTQRVVENTGFDPSKVYVPEFTKLVMEGARKAFDGLSEERIKKESEELMSSILETVPKGITLADIVKTFAKQVKSDYEDELVELESEYGYDEGGEELTVTVSLDVQEELAHPGSDLLSNYKIVTFTLDGLKPKRGKGNEVGFEMRIRMDEEGYGSNKKQLETGQMSGGVYLPSGSCTANTDMHDYAKLNNFEQLMFKLITSHSPIIFNYDAVRGECEFEFERECHC